MTKNERVLTTLAGGVTDRAPFSVYMHSTVHEKTAKKFVEFTLSFYKRFDPDYIKVMFDEHYDLPPHLDFIRSIEVWRELEEFDPHTGAFGRQLAALKEIKDAVGPDVPVIQTLFLPLHFGIRLAYRRILEDWKRSPEDVLFGLDIIAKNSVRFGKACLAEAGIDGFFFGAYGCEQAWFNEKDYKTFAMPSDRLVINALASAPITLLHIHGESKNHFNVLKDYPCRALSWEDRIAGPALKEARSLTGKCLVGGIDHTKAQRASKEEILKESRQALADMGARRFILAPGCTLPPGTPPENILALREAVANDKTLF
jgi:uroporphyrinogen decarboxylase